METFDDDVDVLDDCRSAQALTKDDVSLTITADGRGWTIGVAGAKFTIEPAEG